ncbi:hypothetical protein KFK09_008769 [Dendrobium nobile]|uniref:Uncharacterized protein n=1 Tax=Dendrobium nobile TaxID=94219 RepID=A0A8T3BM29_DENNO|nr:hypothetical protein KFK09_008769 [Dendrobium nobile]
MQTRRLKIGLIVPDDITIIPDDQFKSEENRPEHRPEFVLADMYRPEVTKPGHTFLGHYPALTSGVSDSSRLVSRLGLGIINVVRESFYSYISPAISIRKSIVNVHPHGGENKPQWSAAHVLAALSFVVFPFIFELGIKSPFPIVEYG